MGTFSACGDSQVHQASRLNDEPGTTTTAVAVHPVGTENNAPRAAATSMLSTSPAPPSDVIREPISNKAAGNDAGPSLPLGRRSINALLLD